MALTFQTDYEGVNWRQVTDLLHYYGLLSIPEDLVQKAFLNSYAVVFVKDEAGNTVGCGRAISDGVTQAAIFNVALAEKYHHQGLGNLLMKKLVQQLSGMIITLYTHPKTLEWYKNLGFSKLNTALVRFKDDEWEHMLDMKFINGYEKNTGIFAMNGRERKNGI
ncbi:hypothetical protein FACS1894137_01290 [Spirochaetia bacterium]|nr:hypothetical protein FACS1894137_01290 [Spirochaetia bacterium]